MERQGGLPLDSPWKLPLSASEMLRCAPPQYVSEPGGTMQRGLNIKKLDAKSDTCVLGAQSKSGCINDMSSHPACPERNKKSADE